MKISHPQGVLWMSIIFWGKIEWSFLWLSQLQKLVLIPFHFIDCSFIICASFKIFRWSLLSDWNCDVEWFAMLFEIFLMFSNIFKARWCMTCRYFTQEYFACKSLILHAIYAHVNAAIPMQGCSLRKLKGAQCSEHVKSRVPSIWCVWKNVRFPSRPRAKVGHHRPPGSAGAQPSPWPAL